MADPANPQAPLRQARLIRRGPYGRPANPQGPYGRPANPQGPYGRPANPQGSYGRPANPQQRPFGRPASPQGARPAPGRASRPRQQRSRPAAGKERVSNYDPNKKSYVNKRRDAERTNRNRKHMDRQSARGIMYDDVVRGGRRARSRKPSVHSR